MVKLADKLMSLFIRQTVGMCERCGSKENLQDSHIITRAKQPTRWVRLNHQCLCYRCHIHWFHKGSDPVEVARWVISKIGMETYEQLKILSESGDKPSDEHIMCIIDAMKKAVKWKEIKEKRQSKKKQKK